MTTTEHTYPRIIKDKNVKYRLRETYRDIGIYEEISPNGYRYNQSWMLLEQHLHIFIDSFNNMCYEEILDSIDLRKDTKHYDFRGFMRIQGFIVHPNGDDTL